MAPRKAVSDDDEIVDVEMETEESQFSKFLVAPDLSEIREVRRQYRDLGKDTESATQNSGQITTQSIIDQVNISDNLFKKVNNPAEATLDSALLVQFSNLGAQRARAMKSGAGAFDVDTFITKLVSFMNKSDAPHIEDDEDDDVVGDAGLDWDRIARRVLAKSRRVPVLTHMLGPLSIEAKVRAITKRAKLVKDTANEKRPQEITKDDIEKNENETSKNVLALRKILNSSAVPESGVNLFKFVVNPHDFAQSVENLFYLSFLIRDAAVVFFFDEETGEPLIYACDESAPGSKGEVIEKKQMVMELDMPTWRRAIEVFDIKEPMIPQRGTYKAPLNGKWYG